MASTHTTSTVLASTANTAGSTTNSTSIDNNTSYGNCFFGTMSNGGTGPTLPCQAICQVSNDNSTWIQHQLAVASTTASAVTAFSFVVDERFRYSRVSFTGNTAQSVTCICYASQLTGI